MFRNSSSKGDRDPTFLLNMDQKLGLVLQKHQVGRFFKTKSYSTQTLVEHPVVTVFVSVPEAWFINHNGDLVLYL